MTVERASTRWGRWATLQIGRLWFSLELFPGEGADLSFGVFAHGIWRIARVQV